MNNWRRSEGWQHLLIMSDNAKSLHMLDFYKNDEFSEIVGGPFRVGTNLYGKGTKQYLKMIENSQNSIVFETIDAFY